MHAHREYAGLAALIVVVRPFLKAVSKAKAGKLFRILLDYFLEIPGAVETQVKVCQDCIQWTIEEKHAFLRQALEVGLIRCCVCNLGQCVEYRCGLCRCNSRWATTRER